MRSAATRNRWTHSLYHSFIPLCDDLDSSLGGFLPALVQGGGVSPNYTL